MEKPIVNDSFLLKKFPGKGGWTYADLPQVAPNKSVPFGWVKVRGTIDGFRIRKYNLMPYDGNKLFLAVKSEIRKVIRKQEGDYVHVILYLDNDPLQVPDEMMLCLKDEPKAEKFFNSLTESEQHHYLKWIFSAKTVKTKEERLAQAINSLMKKLRFHDNPKKE